MASYAVIKNNIVDNIILADSKDVAESVSGFTCIEIVNEPGAPGIGWGYEGGEFTPPAAPVIEE